MGAVLASLPSTYRGGPIGMVESKHRATQCSSLCLSTCSQPHPKSITLPATVKPRSVDNTLEQLTLAIGLADAIDTAIPQVDSEGVAAVAIHVAEASTPDELARHDEAGVFRKVNRYHGVSLPKAFRLSSPRGQ